MRCVSKMRLFWVHHWFRHKGFRKVQRHQVKENEKIVDEVKRVKNSSIRDLADVVLRLQAVSDKLETGIQELRGQDD